MDMLFAQFSVGFMMVLKFLFYLLCTGSYRMGFLKIASVCECLYIYYMYACVCVCLPRRLPLTSVIWHNMDPYDWLDEQLG